MIGDMVAALFIFFVVIPTAFALAALVAVKVLGLFLPVR